MQYPSIPLLDYSERWQKNRLSASTNSGSSHEIDSPDNFYSNSNSNTTKRQNKQYSSIVLREYNCLLLGKVIIILPPKLRMRTGTSHKEIRRLCLMPTSLCLVYSTTSSQISAHPEQVRVADSSCTQWHLTHSFCLILTQETRQCPQFTL
jgi:hypothetical protein